MSILRGDVAEGAPWLEPVEIEVRRMRAHFSQNSVATGRVWETFDKKGTLPETNSFAPENG